MPARLAAQTDQFGAVLGSGRGVPSARRRANNQSAVQAFLQGQNRAGSDIVSRSNNMPSPLPRWAFLLDDMNQTIAAWREENSTAELYCLDLDLLAQRHREELLVGANQLDKLVILAAADTVAARFLDYFWDKNDRSIILALDGIPSETVFTKMLPRLSDPEKFVLRNMTGMDGMGITAERFQELLVFGGAINPTDRSLRDWHKAGLVHHGPGTNSQFRLTDDGFKLAATL